MFRRRPTNHVLAVAAQKLPPPSGAVRAGGQGVLLLPRVRRTPLAGPTPRLGRTDPCERGGACVLPARVPGNESLLLTERVRGHDSQQAEGSGGFSLQQHWKHFFTTM